MRSTRTLDAGAAGGSGASLPRPSPRGQVLDSQLLLSNTTSEAVEHALPEATVHSFLATGAPQEIHVLIWVRLFSRGVHAAWGTVLLA